VNPGGVILIYHHWFTHRAKSESLSTYWQGLLYWIKDQPLQERLISPDDMNLLHITGDIDEVVDIMIKHRVYKKAKMEQTKSS
jgi:predicted Rossmann-fold nucleotide-binding protein